MSILIAAADKRHNHSWGYPKAQAVLRRWDCIRWAIDWNAANPAVVVRQRGLPLIR